MAELLLELFSEEIPARFQARAAEDLKRLVAERLTGAGLSFTRADAYVTPRRLALVIDGLPDKQPDVTEEKKGPRVGSPEAAVAGFLNSVGLTSLDQCEKRNVGKAEFWFAVRQRLGQPMADVLPPILLDAIVKLDWPKSMRWAGNAFRWVRPLKSILALLDGKALIGALPLAPGGGGESVGFAGVTFGHRFMAPAEISVRDFADYKRRLRDAKVVLDAAERRTIIATDAEAAAKREGLKLRADKGLLDEVAGLVEWPVVLLGGIDPRFMDLPPEVLTTTMRRHQKYFALEKADGSLAPRFVVVANIEAEDGGKAIVLGNERVLRARLSDARFYWDQDRKQPLESRLPALEKLVFHAKLGSVGDKVRRLERLAEHLATSIPGADPARARRAARLSKADLSSGMVGEFPELQGIMGRYYALHDGADAAVAEAIAQHYGPLGPNDRCPTAPIALAVALADKIDTLAGFFKIGEKPTGSKDPFALRRAAQGVIRLILENGLRLKLSRIFGGALALHGAPETQQRQRKAELAEALEVGGAPVKDIADLTRELLEFLADRLKVHLRERGVRHDLIEAIFGLGGEDDLVRLLARVDSLAAFLAGEDGGNLLTAYRRASNIVAIEEKKDGAGQAGPVDAAAFVLDEERRLYAALADVRESCGRALREERFNDAMANFSRLRKPVDAFFEKVTVNVEDRALRANRLRLLSEIRVTLGTVGDFSRIEG